MVLAEVPLWVNHGSSSTSNNNADSRALVPGMPGLGNSNNGSSNGSTNGAAGIRSTDLTDDKSAAKSAMALLSSTRSNGAAGAGRRSAPLYSVDVHPDGTRFATAAGDGTVKVWSLGCLFDGKLLIDTDNNEDGAGGRGDAEGATTKSDGKGKRRRRRGMASSRFTQEGNYVSSNSEDYCDTSSSEDGSGGNGVCVEQQQQQQRQSAPGTPQAGVNDLSGLVRKKKGGGNKPPGSSTPVKPFAASSNTSANSGSASPLTKLTQNPTGAKQAENTDAAASDTPNNPQNPSPNIDSNTSKKKKKKKKLPKLLSTLSSHEGSVLSLRFSPSGTYLATAGDDSYVNIYKRCATPSLAKGNLVGNNNSGGSGGDENGEDVEHWNRIAICRGHHLDVVGLAWAPDDSHLASCSLDSHNPVIIWKLYDVLSDGDNNNSVVGAAGNGLGTTVGGSAQIHNLHPFQILGRDEHTSTVKGVAFDPAGKYVVTSGDDPAICIWRASGDWGLEARVDGKNSGVFRSKKRRVRGGGAKSPNNTAEGAPQDEEEEDDPGELASLSLFRRISFAPDGSHVCGTNATLRGKNIAAMISREGWTATGSRRDGEENGGSGGGGPPPGAANLVGHKQPVVASRHCPVFFAVPKKKRRSPDDDSSSSSSSEEEPDNDGEVEYATLVALGDKRGFVTIWSTKSNRPLFKMQCSESRCTVTDLSWGLVRKTASQNDDGVDEEGGDSLILIVSLLDGYVIALHFDIPTEVGGGPVLSLEKTRQIFRNRYGIEDFNSYGFLPGKKSRKNKRLVDDAGPMLIENALQLTMEMEAEAEEGMEDYDEDGASGEDEGNDSNREGENQQSSLSEGGVAVSGNIKDTQIVESTKSGKKRIRPVLMNVNNDNVSGGAIPTNVSDDGVEKETSSSMTGKKRRKKGKEAPQDSLRNALDAASQAASLAEGVSAQAVNRSGDRDGVAGSQNAAAAGNARSLTQAAAMESHSTTTGPALRIPYNTNKVFSVDLTSKSNATLPSTVSMSSLAALENLSDNKIVADCTNSTTSPTGGTSSWPCATLTIGRNGVRQWRDILLRTKCTAMAADDKTLVVGTADGCMYLYQTSPTLGWMSGKAFRAFPPFVLGSPVVEISIHTASNNLGEEDVKPSDMVVVTSDGNFYVYILSPMGPKLNYKGGVVQAMQHMYLSSRLTSTSLSQPKLARIQITDSKQLMIILVSPPSKSSSTGRLLQGFIYCRDMELWMRISDSNNFVLSDLYPSLSGLNVHRHSGDDDRGILSKMDRLVKSSASTMASAKQLYQKAAENQNHGSGGASSNSQNVITRSHCEDRLACSIALGSAFEFQTWLQYYARCLSTVGDGDALRFLVDILLGGVSSDDGAGGEPIPSILSFALGSKQSCLGLDRKDVIRKAILPEMSKNRLLQRLTNEMAMELNCS